MLHVKLKNSQVVPSDKVFGLVSCERSLLGNMKYYIVFRKIQDLDVLKEEIFRTTLRNGDLQITYKTYHEFIHKSNLYSYTLETKYIKTLGDVFDIRRTVLDLTNLAINKIVTKRVDSVKILNSQSIRTKSTTTTKEVLNDLAISIAYAVDKKITITNGMLTREIEDQYRDGQTVTHPSGKIITHIDKRKR